MEGPKILVADDDQDIVNLIADSLEEEGYRVLKASNGKQVIEIIIEADLSLVILDIMMPGLDGLEVCRKIRNEFLKPIILLSAKNRELDKVIGLEVGADDYITKPFSVNELVARVKAHIRRDGRLLSPKPDKSKKSNHSPVLSIGDLLINKETYEVYKGDIKIDLSTKEFQILLHLIENRNRVLSREQIYEAIWGDVFGDISTVTVHIRNIRNKIDNENIYIKTVWGIGYKIIGG